MDELVQPIIVAKTGSHETTVRLGALASVKWGLINNLTAAEQAILTTWLAGRFTKSVRRASYEQMVKIINLCQAGGITYSNTTLNDSAAIALPPMFYREYPKLISKLQVSGTDFPREEGAGEALGSYPVAVLNTLTTGKATAQAAHGLWKQVLAKPPFSIDILEEAFTLHFQCASQLENLAQASPTLAVWDSGLTEIAPHTLTAAHMLL